MTPGSWNFGRKERPGNVKYILDPKYRFNVETRQIENSKTERAIPTTEPIIILRAQDKCTVAALDEYFARCCEANASKEHLQSIRERINEFRIWQRANYDKVKTPD